MLILKLFCRLAEMTFSQVHASYTVQLAQMASCKTDCFPCHACTCKWSIITMLTWIFFFFPFQFLFLLSNIDVRFRSQMTLLLAENIMKYMCFVELEWTSEWHRFIQAYNYLRWFSSQLSQLHVWGKLLTTEVSSSLSGESCITQDKSRLLNRFLSRRWSLIK